MWRAPRCHVVLLVVSFPTKFVKSSPYFSITNLAVKNWHWKSSPMSTTICFGIHGIDPSVCFENTFHTGSKYSWLPCFCQLYNDTSTVPFCLRWILSGDNSQKNWGWTIFFLNGWTVGHCHTSPGGAPGTRLGQGNIKFLFCEVLGPVNRRENWKTWESRGENLDCQSFHGLIIKPFDNQTVSLHWWSRIPRISDTSENQSPRLDSDNQINISRLISCLDLSTKSYCQVFFWVLIDLIVELLGLIIKSFDNQTESWNPVSNDLIIKSFDTIIW